MMILLLRKPLFFLKPALMVFLLSVQLQAQDKEFEEWLKKDQKNLEQFLSEEDKKFTDFLRKEWIKQGLNEADFPLEKPKPKTPPVFKPENDPVIPRPEKPDQPVIPPPPDPEELPDAEVPPPVPLPGGPAASVYTEQLRVDYFGSQIILPFNPQLAVSLKGEISGPVIADYWRDISSKEHNGLIDHFRKMKLSMRLNDFGFARLVYAAASQRFASENERVLFSWFVLNKAGYRARVAYLNKDIYLLLHSENQVYGVRFFLDNSLNKRFYLLPVGNRTLPSGSMYMYKEDFPDADKPVSFGFEEMPLLGDTEKSRKISFMYGGKEYQVTLLYNEEMTRYFEWYPQTDFPVYFSTGLHSRSSEQLLFQLRQLITGMKQTEAANFLLHFVQQATEYKTDDEQFNREKPFFAEESLRYPYSDCEDRSVLYAYLIRKLLNLEVIGLDYPDHIATAVRFTEQIEGDAIEWEGKKFYICDPTYIGADIAISMPAYQNVTPQVIAISSK